MSRWQGLEEIPADWNACSVTIGVFDGVHHGHQHVVRRAVSRGQAAGIPTVAVTFDPRPVELFAPEKAPPLLTSVPARIGLLGALGVDAVLVLPFTRELSQLSPEDFIRKVLVEQLHVRAVTVGEEFRFGHRAAGDVELLGEFGEPCGFEVEGVPPVKDEDGNPYSSSRARQDVAGGEVVAAARVLGRPHRVEGTVMRGEGRGRELGYPTANVDYPVDRAVPADGVYAGWLYRLEECLDGRTGTVDGDQRCTRWPAAISIGTNPTFAGASRNVEVYALDRADLDLYGCHVTVEFAEWLRDTLRFDSVGELVDEMGRDVQRARAILDGARGATRPAPPGLG